MPTSAEIIFTGRDWLLPAIGLGVLGGLSLLWSYGRSVSQPGTRPICMLLRVLGLSALILCLLEPQWSGQRAKPGANLFAVVADNSQGMEIHDYGNPESRGDALKKLVKEGESQWISSLQENFNARNYLFDSKLRSTDSFKELDFKGRSSALWTSLKLLRERYEGRPLAGILLLTDGNATDLPESGIDLAGLPPIYPVVIGRDDPGKDVTIEKITVTQTSFEDAPVTIDAQVQAIGFTGQKINGVLLDQTGKEIANQSFPANDKADRMSFRFKVRPEKQGVSFYRLKVGKLGDHDKSLEETGEATLANNRRIIAVDRGKGPYRILYVSGRPNWEFKFLNRALLPDDQTDLVGLIRIARREPKFVFRGRTGETSNPLFRGFGDQSEEEIQRYDQPVMIRLNTKDSEELSAGFPRTAKELYGFSAIIVDDMESAFFTADQKALLQTFVSERGGGFMMLGGIDTFRDGKYDRTPIGDLLPVYLNRGNAPNPDTDLKMELTREGWLQTWARLRETEQEEKIRMDNMPAFGILNPLPEVKPGASVISTVTDEHGIKHPALTVQRFGNGRVAALTLGDFWRWGMRDPEMHVDFDKAWRQMVRWLVADIPQRIDLETKPRAGDPNQAVELTVRARDPKFQPLDNASVSLQIHPIDKNGQPGDPIRLQAEPSNDESGLYQATYIPRGTGGYYVQTMVTNAAGAEVGKAEAGWTTDHAAEEFRSLTPNRAFLETLARQTGGEIVKSGSLNAFVKTLETRKAPVTESWTKPLWHTPWFFLLALSCFVLEWGVRRWRGMA
jgi:uncharacterized membrane protein